MAPPGRSTSILYISHNGLTEPLGRRQVLPYVKGLARLGWRFRVISFEKPGSASKHAVRSVEAELAGLPVEWLALRYHQRPALISTALEFLHGVARAALGPVPGIIHARSSVPAMMAVGLAAAWRVPWVFDVRGFLAEEYADAGHWRRKGAVYRSTRAAEKWTLQRASATVVLTHRVIRDLAEYGGPSPSRPQVVIPCAVDLETFRPDLESRLIVRRQLQIGESSPVLTYAGTLGSWYRLPEMLDFFSVARHLLPELVFLVLTPQPALARAEIARRGLGTQTRVLELRPEAVPSYMAAADVGICFLSDVPSKRASSPTKYGEYLASGLAVIATRWTGDVARYENEPAWILVDGFNETSYQLAALRLASLLGSRDGLVDAARSHAKREFALDTAVARYDALYRRVLGDPPKAPA